METMDKIFYDEIILKFKLNNSKKDKDYLIEFSLEDKSIKFETEKIKSKTENSLLEFSKDLICPYYFYKIQNIYLRVKKWKDRIHYAYLKFDYNIHLTLSTIINAKNMLHEIKIIEKNEDLEKIIIQAEKVNNTNNNSLVNYLSAGISFESYIGIDFSDKMLHNVDIAKNQYLNAIRGFRETLFDFQRNFEVYGFGANLLDYKNDKDNSFFNLSLSENPLFGLTKIKEAYIECLKKIDFSENNNYLSPLLNHIQKRIYEKNNLTNYYILFLLINKCPKKDDIQNTIDALIQTSFLPLSIVIIGIGDNENEFNNIKNLYMNNNVSSKGIKKFINNIFFISMKECNYEDSILKDICLKEIPRQLTSFYELSNISIKQIKEKYLKSIYERFQNLNIQNNFIQKDYKTNIDSYEGFNPAPPLVNNDIEINIDISKNYPISEAKNKNNSNIQSEINLQNDKMDNNNNDKKNENNNNEEKNNNFVNKRKSLPDKDILNNLNNNIININNNESYIPEQKINDNEKNGIKNILNPDCSIFRSAIRKKSHNRQKSMEMLQNIKIILPENDNKDIDNNNNFNNNNLIKSNLIKVNPIKNKDIEIKVKTVNNVNKNEEKNNNNNYKRLETISEGSLYNYNYFKNNNNTNNSNNINTFLSREEESLLSENKDNLLENKTNDINYSKLPSFHIEKNSYNDNNDIIFLGNSRNEEQNNINNKIIQQDSINPISINNSIEQPVTSISSNLSDSQQSEIVIVSKINMFNN